MPAPGTITPLTEEQQRAMESFAESLFLKRDSPQDIAFRRRMGDLAQYIADGPRPRGR